MKDKYLKIASDNLLPLKTEEIRLNIPPRTLVSGDRMIIDLGEHYVGRFSFDMWFLEKYIDAPVRLKINFCETERELQDNDADYSGWICSSWIQEEIVNVDFPGTFSLPRRYSARYISILVLAAPKPLVLRDFVFVAESAVSLSECERVEISDSKLAKIDKVAVNTLKNCMQRVFEDGPKRDRRLWIGDLRLEALANYYTFKNVNLVRRCLYLFAAADRSEEGFLPGFVYENPIFFSGEWYLQDYSLLYVVTLCEYLIYTGDRETFAELYPLAKSVIESAIAELDGRGIIRPLTSYEDVFIDWCVGLNKAAAFMGVYLYTLEIFCSALRLVESPDLQRYEDKLTEGRECAKRELYCEAQRAVVSEYDAMQRSVHSTVWVILGGVLSGEEGLSALKASLADSEAKQPFTPYMHHYVMEAFIKLGELREAEKYMRYIWGGMVDMGFNCFPEAYRPGDPDFSPYDDRRVNSMCHAWSCTPTYIIRKYKLGM